MSLSARTRLGPYEILSPLGAGGMGEVYRAKDMRVDRVVALKVLPEEFFEDEDRRTRFGREAKLLASLNHPGIATLYSFEEIAGRNVLSMELVEGEDLGQKLVSGPVPLEESLSLARQIAEALEGAHEKGIVHRDLKPANVKVTPDGRVKLLDFGLAKAFEKETGAGSAPSATHSPTLTARATTAGVILGTAAYMSPEQARGRPVDKRTDVWAFGCVLYEMLAGKKAFEGETVSDAIASILTKEPDWAALPEQTPSAVRRVLRKCLQRDAKLRLRDIGDARLDLQEIEAAPRSSTSRSPYLLWVLAAAFAVAAGALALRARAPEAAALRFKQITFHRGTIESARFSPDGQTVVFGSTRRDGPLRVYTSRLDSIEPRALDVPAGATVAGVSRTGEMLLLLKCAHHGFWIRSGTLARVPLGGGTPREILEHVADADIAPDGKDLAVVREAGRVLEFPLGKVLLETDGWVSHVRISPDGTQVAFLEHPTYGNDNGYVCRAPAGGRPERLTGMWSGAQGLAWSRDGKEIWATLAEESQESNSLRHQLWAIRPGGKPRLLLGPPMSLCVHDVSSTGAVLLSGEDRRGEVGGLLAGETRERDLSTWADEAVSGISADGSMYSGIEQSAPGTGVEPIFYYRRAGESSPVILGNGDGAGMSPDGRWVTRHTTSKGAASSLSVIPTGAGDPRPLPIGDIRVRTVLHEPVRWSSDGRRILFAGAEPDHPARTFVLDLVGGAPRPATPEGVTLAVLSPDGGSVAFREVGGRMVTRAVAGGAEAAVPGALPDDLLLEWEEGGKALFVWDRNWPARLFRLELATGRRTLWKELTPDPVGLMYGNIILTRDGRHYVYRLRRVYSELNVAEGLK